jgi:FkbM family methyltransferase
MSIIKKSFFINKCLSIYQRIKCFEENIPVSISLVPTEQHLLKSLISDNKPIIFDIGANLGTKSKYYSKLFPHSIIYSFEPDPDTFHILHKKFKENTRIYLYNIGISDSKKIMELHRTNISSNNSFYRLSNDEDYVDAISNLREKDSVKVNTTSLDEFCDENNISYVHYIKLDVQGYEPQCLSGAKELIRSQKIGVLRVEITPGKFYERSTTLHEVESHLFPHYKLYSLLGCHYGKGGDLIYFDAVFTKN